MWVAFAHIFSVKKFQHIWVSLYVNFNESLTNDVVSFEQLELSVDGFCIYALVPKICLQLKDVYSNIWIELKIR